MHKQDTLISKKFHDYFRSFFKQVKRPIKKNFLELARGLVLGNTVIVSEVVRINDKKINVRKGVERIGEMLDKIESKELNEYMLFTKHARNINENTIIAIDNSDTIKEYAKSLEGMSRVHDGSKGEIKNGFEIFGSSYIDDEGNSHMLQFELYSRETNTYESEYKEWEKNMNSLCNIIHPDAGIFVMDCGYDGNKYYEYLLNEQKDFVIRINDRRPKSRKVYCQEFKEKWDIEALPYSKEKKIQVKIKNKKNNRLEDVTIKLSKVKIKLKENGEFLNVIKIKRIKKGSKSREMYLITTLKASGVQQMLNVYEIYLKRWKIEELFRSMKQHFQIEKIQLRKLKRIQAMYRIICIMHNFLRYIEIWSEKTKNSVFYKAKKIQNNTQKMSLFTAIFRLTKEEWMYWQFNRHSMFFRSINSSNNSLQLNLFSNNLLFNL